jgi:hypothetical protein
MMTDHPDDTLDDEAWEDAVEAELKRLAAEVERLNHELVKIGSQTAQLMRDRRDAAKGGGKSHSRSGRR